MPAGDLPTVSVVVPAFDEEAAIERCLAALAAQTEPAHEILVVDNRSADRTPQLVRDFAARHPGTRIALLMQRAEQGLVPTRDAGFAAATGDVVGRIDADTVVQADWIERVAERFRDPAVDAITGPVGYYDLPFVTAGRWLDHLTRLAILAASPRYPFLFGSNMAVRRSALEAVRGRTCRDRADRFHEDIDLSIHLTDAGCGIRYASEMRATISARRLGTSADHFADYAGRFDRTYRAHGITAGSPALAGALLLTCSPALRRLYARAGKPATPRISAGAS